MASILISGGTGLIGKQLSKLLRENGHVVRILSRKPSNNNTFIHWDIDQQYISENALIGIDTIVHLAGEGIADGKWTDERKKEIFDSRVNSTKLLYSILSKGNHQVKSFISASAVGYYSEQGDKMMVETDSANTDFLGATCLAWENELDKISSLNIRTVKLRTGIVLSLAGGALKKMILSFKFGFGSAIGDGKQWMSWIHEKDLCKMYVYAIENANLTGAYNAVAPIPVRNNEFSKLLASALKKPFWFPNVPKFMLQLLFGEMSIVILGSTKASSQKIEDAGFEFQFRTLDTCLKNLVENK
jgi:uncharacterized protein (TIGR01777 family)